jgi:hypothetical protein
MEVAFTRKQPQGESGASSRRSSGARGAARGLRPRDPVAYAQMVWGDQDEGLALGSDEHGACIEFVAENPPSVLLAIGGAMLEPVKAAPDRQLN